MQSASAYVFNKSKWISHDFGYHLRSLLFFASMKHKKQVSSFVKAKETFTTQNKIYFDKVL